MAKKKEWVYGRVIEKNMSDLTATIREIQDKVEIISIQRESSFFGLSVRYVAFYRRVG